MQNSWSGSRPSVVKSDPVCRQLSVVPSWIRCTIEPRQRPSKERITIPEGMYLPEIIDMLEWQRSVSWAKLKKGVSMALREWPLQSNQKKGEAPYGGKQLQHSLAQWVTRGKKANCSTLLRRIARLKIVNSESGRGSDFLPRKVFTTGLMSSCRIQHESHTCSDLSYRIVMWNASNMQKTFH